MPRLKGGKTRVEEEGAEHISTQDVEDAQLRATLAATHVDELRAQVVDCSSSMLRRGSILSRSHSPESSV